MIALRVPPELAEDRTDTKSLLRDCGAPVVKTPFVMLSPRSTHCLRYIMSGAKSLCALAFLLCFILVLKASYAVDTCIEGPLHKSKPGPEGPDYAECFPWKENSCCTADFTIQLAKDRVESLYNLTYNHCGNLSQRCEAFVKNEECFWQCEPNLIKWHKSSGIIDRAPICGSYCDAWFLACQDDMTCVQDWLNGFNYTSSTYTCPVKNKCRTFKEIFKSGEVLCNTMWGSSFKYEASNKNCMVMNFTGPNPNTKVSPTISSANTIAQLSLLLPVIIVFKMLIL